jgi:hypothetical protein
MKKVLTQEELFEILAYSPTTGLFTRKVSLASNKFKAGTIAGYTKKDGYSYITINRNVYPVHRLAWLYTYGEFPSEQIDHVDGNPLNNRLMNLRECNQKDNMCNRAMTSRNVSGTTGVYLQKSGKYEYWVAQWQIGIGKIDRKLFSVKILGFEKAKTSATAYREKKLKQLILGGGTYTYRHGLSKEELC